MTVRLQSLFVLLVWAASSIANAQETVEPPQVEPANDPAADTKPADKDQAVESGPLAGHSNHGEIFNEGARQHAYLMSGMSNVQFKITTSNDEVQKFFNQGVSQLHGFWYLESERSFRHAASLDPDCAMTYWGMAMSNMGNTKRGKGFIAEATKRKASVSDRERRYIDALHAFLNADTSNADKRKARGSNYIKSFERILYEYPDDVDAKAFLALEFWKRRSDGLKIYSHLSVDALLSEVFAANPMHPSHHYRIHLWDGERPKKALTAAAICGQTMPGVAHMWHMPGHIYSRLKRYNDAVWQQEASARVDHAHMMRDRVLPDQIHNFAHNNEWLIRNLIFIGRASDAVDLAKNMTELPQHPKYNHLGRGGCSASYGRTRLFQVLQTFELWDLTIELCDTPYLEATDIPREQAKRLRALGRAYFRSGDKASGNAAIEELNQMSAAETKKRDKAIAKAVEALTEKDEKKRKAAEAKIKKDKTRAFATTIREFDQAGGELTGWLAVAEGDFKTALEKLKKARVSGPRLAAIHIAAGENDKASAELTKFVARHSNEVVPLAQATHLYAKIGKKDEARKQFDNLRKLSAEIDLETPVFQCLAELAKEWGFEKDWRVENKVANDVGQRPELDALGPFRWTPLPAPDWSLRGSDGKSIRLNDYEGKPVVVIFFLGYGCLHCAEQLQAFAPKMEAFKEAGIEVIAISSDDDEGLRKSVENYDGPVPIPLVADPDLAVFRSYRAHDDFEEMPLHGTFLIDAQGMVRWQDISYE
ncbi:MAG: redoxin domain-containing protein, partial [Pirellulaceae bacterium]